MTETKMAPPAPWDRLARATDFALAVHGEQFRKGTSIPYISHLFSVAGLVLEHGGDEDQAIAGLLHDAVEDHGIEQQPRIQAQFGNRVARIVADCTDADTFPKPPWLERKERYLAHLRQVPPDSLLVSGCDKLHNARAIVTDVKTHGLALFDRFSQPRERTLWYYRSLAEIFSERLRSALSRELAGVVDEMQSIGSVA